MSSFIRPRFTLTVALSLATLAAGIVISSEAKCIVPNKKQSAAEQLAARKKKLQANRSHARSSKTTAAKSGRVSPADTTTNFSSINRKHALKIEKVRTNSVKTSQSVSNPGEAQYQAEMREYEQKKRDYEKALAAYEARKLALRAEQSKAASSTKSSAAKSKAMSSSAATTLQTGSSTQVSPSAASVSTAVAPAPEASAASTNPFILKYDGSYEGPAIQTLGAYKPNKDGTVSDDPQSLINIFTLGYKISPTLAIKAGPMFITPLAGNGDMTWLDPFLRLDIGNVYSRGPVSFSTDFRLYPGITDGAKKAGRIARLRNTQILGIDMGKGFSFGWTSYLRFSAYQREGFEDAKQGDDWKIYVNPALSYAFTDTLSSVLQWEGETAHLYGEDPGFNTGSSGQLKIGLAWTPIANLEFDPMIGMATGEGTRLFDGRSAQLLMDFTIKAF